MYTRKAHSLDYISLTTKANNLNCICLSLDSIQQNYKSNIRTYILQRTATKNASKQNIQQEPAVEKKTRRISLLTLYQWLDKCFFFNSLLVCLLMPFIDIVPFS